MEARGSTLGCPSGKCTRRRLHAARGRMGSCYVFPEDIWRDFRHDCEGVFDGAALSLDNFHQGVDSFVNLWVRGAGFDAEFGEDFEAAEPDSL